MKSKQRKDIKKTIEMLYIGGIIVGVICVVGLVVKSLMELI